MIISYSQKLIFVHVQRTGGASIINLLKQQLGDKVEIISQHGNVKSVEKKLVEDHKDYFSFVFVRNPWERILSWYLLINKANHGSIEEEKFKYQQFLELDLAAVPGDLDFHYNQLDYVSDEVGELLVKKIYRFEKFESEVVQLFKDLNLPMIDIPKMNATWEKDYRKYYSIKSQELISLKCKKDIEYFRYSF